MKKDLKWIKIMALILVGAMAGIAFFSFIVAKILWFPNTTTTQDSKAGVAIKARSYSQWLWNRKNITKITIFDRKNDGPDFEIKLNGLIDSSRLAHGDTIRLVHSGWNLAVVAVRMPSEDEQYYRNALYVLHRMPKADGQESLEYKYAPGDILAVVPDEETYFYKISNMIIRRNWENKDLVSINIPTGYDENFFFEDPVFFSNNSKMALKIYNRNTRDISLIIWNLLDNTTNIISITDLFPNYVSGKLSAEDYGIGDLYITREDISVKRVKVYE